MAESLNGKMTKAAISGRLVIACEFYSLRGGLSRFYVLGLPALRALDHVKLHLLTLLQAAESARLNGGEMYEYILAVLAADETVTLGIVKPLHCSCFHVVANFLFL